MRRYLVGILGLCFIVSIIYIVYQGQQVEYMCEKEGDNGLSVTEFYQDFSNQMKNQDYAFVSSDGTHAYIKSYENIPYIGKKGSIMYPIDMLREEYNCAVNIYADGKIVVEKGDITLLLHTDSDGMRINNNNQMTLSNPTEKKDGVIYIPFEDLMTALSYQVTWETVNRRFAVSDVSVKNDLPKKYDYRQMKKETPVGDQKKLGTCWAFAALSALESSLMPQKQLSLSVDHMTLQSGFQISQEGGGDQNVAIAYMSSWRGPVLASDDPYDDGKTNKSAQTAVHLEEARIISGKNIEKIKSYVYKYGGYQTSVYTNQNTAEDWSKYYNKETSAFYCDETHGANHELVIVGWDDDYQKDNFVMQPKKKGAFICKNSWGKEFGEDGYFYVSYQDANIGNMGSVYTKVGATDNFDHIYQSDQLGMVGQLGYDKPTGYFANVYTATGEENLQAVGFYATAPATLYEVYVIHNFKDKDSFQEREFLTSGGIDEMGYYTIRFSNDVELEPGERYAVMVKVKAKSSLRPIAVEYAASARTEKAVITDGEGYISPYGEYWERVETTQNCNVCLKAFTKNR